MKTFNINQYCITVTDEFGDKTSIPTSSARYADAKEAVMSADWSTFYRLAETNEMDEIDLSDIIDADFGERGVGILGLIGMITGLTIAERAEDDSPEFEAGDSFAVGDDNIIATVKSMLADGIISAEDLITEDNIDLFADAMPQSSEPSHEHDLSNWNGSPIFYPTREMAQEQAEASYGFWLYHDFGIASPADYRYATVPRGVGPYAPTGYDWKCVPREE